jgi:hypothetical protein
MDLDGEDRRMIEYLFLPARSALLHLYVMELLQTTH